MTDFIVKMQPIATTTATVTAPTHDELTRLFGDPSTFADGWMSLVYSADQDDYYLCVVYSGAWIVFQGDVAL